MYFYSYEGLSCWATKQNNGTIRAKRWFYKGTEIQTPMMYREFQTKALCVLKKIQRHSQKENK